MLNLLWRGFEKKWRTTLTWCLPESEVFFPSLGPWRLRQQLGAVPAICACHPNSTVFELHWKLSRQLQQRYRGLRGLLAGKMFEINKMKFSDRLEGVWKNKLWPGWLENFMWCSWILYEVVQAFMHGSVASLLCWMAIHRLVLSWHRTWWIKNCPEGQMPSSLEVEIAKRLHSIKAVRFQWLWYR